METRLHTSTAGAAAIDDASSGSGFRFDQLTGGLPLFKLKVGLDREGLIGALAAAYLRVENGVNERLKSIMGA